MVLMVAVPIMIQNGITNFVSLLDNIMVGRVGTEQMSGVAIVNQLIVVFNICIFGCVSGAGIFGAQFYGKGDTNGVRNTFRFKIFSGILLLLFWIAVFTLFENPLIHLFLHEGSGAGDLEATYRYGREYLMIMLVGLIPSLITQVYASTLRETGETILPMKAGIAAVCTNLLFDYIFIFGMGSIPALGVAGAAIATDIARFIECGIVVSWTHKNKAKNTFISGAYQHFSIPKELSKQIILKGTPLLINETMWSMGMAMLTQCYSTRGLAIVAGLNISTTVSNLFNVVFIALGSAISIIIGQLLGAGKLKEAVETDYKMIFFSVAVCLGIGSILFIIAPVFPQIYNTTEEVRLLATQFLRVASAYMPIHAFVNALYFTLRSGGKTFVTFLFDSVYVWIVNIPLAFVLTRFTGMPIVLIYFLCQFVDIFKCIIGTILVKKKVWVNDMTGVHV
ncbi:MAG: MATE family efflux transporter [Lachnospiraceae bacterium]|nr:MATE family efflux transporter [Lachnospiraceae bacterium]